MSSAVHFSLMTSALLDDERHVVLVAVRPVLIGLGGGDDRMPRLVVVGGGGAVGGGVAAADLAAGAARAQVHPAVAGLQALLAALDVVRRSDSDLVQVVADGHDLSVAQARLRVRPDGCEH